jgi:uracil phosphoribosyltransferase
MKKYPFLRILSSKSIDILMSKLRDKNTGASAFRLFADRIMRILIEEAFAEG